MRCSDCQQYGHVRAAHVATCVVCGAERNYPIWSVCLKETDESPYRKGHRIYNCGDELEHQRIRDTAAALPGGGDPPRKGAVASMSKQELETLGRLPW